MSAKPTVVFLHGFALGVRSWRPQTSADLGCPVVAFEALGHEHGKALERTPGPNALVEELALLLEGLPSGRIILVGLSMGGHTALLYTARRDPRVAGVVLLGTGGEEADPAGFRRRAIGYADLLSGDEGIAEFAENFLAQSRFGTLSVEQRSFVLGCIRRQDPEALSVVAREVLGKRVPFSQELAGVRLDVPALVIVGEEDRSCVRALPSLRQVLPSAELHILTSCGHLCNIERPRHINHLIASFADRVGMRR